ncbi:MAG: CHASE2 domain-containing protein, partial [Planctomycetota bacterium]
MARVRRWNWLLQALAAALLAIGLRLAPIGEHWQRSLWDHLVATWRGSDPSGEVVLVAIDTASTGRFGRWPWPAARTHRLLDAIADLGAREIVCTFEPPGDFDATGHRPPVRPRGYRFRPFDPDNPIEPTARPGTERGLSWIPVEGRVRSLPVAVRLRTEGWSPSLLGTALARRFGAADTAALAAPDDPFGRAEIRFGTRHFPVRVAGAVARLPLSSPQRAGSVPTVSAARLLDGELDGSGVLRGRTVVLGPTDPSCARLYPALGARDVPSSEPELWAAGLDAALSGRLLHWQPPASAAVWLVLGLLVLSILLRQAGPAPGALLSIGVLLAVYAASVGAVRRGTLLETLPWYAGVLGLYGALQLERASGALRRERQLGREIERTDRRLVPPRADADRWQAALAMADQFLETDSLVLLRLEPETGR